MIDGPPPGCKRLSDRDAMSVRPVASDDIAVAEHQRLKIASLWKPRTISPLEGLSLGNPRDSQPVALETRGVTLKKRGAALQQESRYHPPAGPWF